MSSDANKVYQCLLDSVANQDATVTQLILGLTWTLSRSDEALGLAMTPSAFTRTLSWPGTIKGRKLKAIASWIDSWNPFEASVALSAINALLTQTSSCYQNAYELDAKGPGNLRVFEHFRPLLHGKNVVVVGRYPGLEQLQQELELIVLEQNPQSSDLPAQACEYVIPNADWVFVSGTTIANKTFPRIAELATDANLVLMGPSVPWLDNFADFGVDYLVGTKVANMNYLLDTVAEGGGTRIFEGGVNYCCFDFTSLHMEKAKDNIARIVSDRNQLKLEMEQWYQRKKGTRFPKAMHLQQLDSELSRMDNRYRRLWDANNKTRGNMNGAGQSA